MPLHHSMSFFHEKSTDTRVDVDYAYGIPDRSEAPICLTSV